MISDFFYPSMGGVENHVYQLAQCLLMQGHKVVVVTHRYGGRCGVRWLPRGLKVYYLPFCGVHDRVILPTGLMLLPLLGVETEAQSKATREPAVAQLHLVDANPAQLALNRLKLGLLSEEPRTRRELLGHDPLPAAERAEGLAALGVRCEVDLTLLGPSALLAERGPDRCGRYEETFAALRRSLGDPAPLERLLLAPTGPEQASLLAELEPELARAFAEVFALPGLVALFGPDATANRLQPFSAHFHQRTLHALRDPTLPARENPYLWSVLLGRLPPEVVRQIMKFWLHAGYY